MDRQNGISAAYVREIFEYDPETGSLFWKLGSKGVAPGARAGTIDSQGYVCVRHAGRSYCGHRLAWALVTGEFPEGVIDHINGNRSDNRLCNLRSTTQAINIQNRKRAQKNSASGLIGAHSCIKTGRWRASICVDGKITRLGYFDAPEQAHEAYLQAKRRLHQGCTI